MGSNRYKMRIAKSGAYTLHFDNTITILTLPKLRSLENNTGFHLAISGYHYLVKFSGDH